MKFQTQLTAKDIFKFSMTYTYSGVSGVMAVLMVIIGFLMLYRGIVLGGGMSQLLFGIVIIALFVVINPMMLYIKAKKQVLSNPVYQQPTYYSLEEEGISVKIGEETGTIDWWRIIKMKHRMGLYIFYTGRQQAFVFPEETLGDKKEEIIDYIMSHMKNSTPPKAKQATEVKPSISKYTQEQSTTEDETVAEEVKED